MDSIFQPLPPSFFNQHSLELAQHLLGQLLVNETDEGIVSGIIVETEAYLGLEDRAAHSYGKRRTKRTEIMYHAPGHAYIYQMHTHHLINIVSGAEGDPQAVLIRAVEPLTGIHLMEKRRPVMKRTNLTSGPGKLSKAFGITMDDYGRTLFGPPLFIARGVPAENIATGKRIGIDNTGEAKDYLYRFWVKGNPYVSR